MATVLQATDNESPDSGQGGQAVTGVDDTSHDASTSSVTIGSEDSDSQVKTARWFAFSQMQASPIKLKFSWTISGQLELVAADQGITVSNAVWRVQFSKNGGANWTTVLERTFSRNTIGTTPISDSGSESITLTDTFNTGPIQVRDRIEASASSEGDPTVSASSSLTAEISGIELEATPIGQIVVMM